jgi:DNA-binding transcriptional LysR family regulator
MSITKYKAIIAVVESGSLTKAAHIMNYSQPGISHMIDSLEAEIGLTLLNRSRDAIGLTENGKQMLEHFRRVVEYDNALKKAASSINGMVSGSLRIGAQNSMIVSFVAKAVSEFTQIHPNVEIKIEEYPFSGMRSALGSNLIDIGFMSEHVPKHFDFIPLLRDSAVLIMHMDHTLSSYEKVPASVLNGCNFLMPIAGWDDVVNAVMEKEPFRPNTKHYIASDAAAVSMVQNRLGVAILSSLQCEYLPDTVVAKPFIGDFGRNCGIAVRSEKDLTAAQAEFIRIAREVVATDFPEIRIFELDG